MTATTTIIGNLTADAELRYSQNGLAIANFTVASTEKKFDKATNEWVDGKKLFMRCTAWRELAEHVAGSLSKGTRVIVVGKISTREWEDKDGGKRSSIELEVDEIGPSLRYATAQVTRTTKGASTGPTEQWAQPPSEPTGDVWNQPTAFNDETPF